MHGRTVALDRQHTCVCCCLTEKPCSESGPKEQRKTTGVARHGPCTPPELKRSYQVTRRGVHNQTDLASSDELGASETIAAPCDAVSHRIASASCKWVPRSKVQRRAEPSVRFGRRPCSTHERYVHLCPQVRRPAGISPRRSLLPPLFFHFLFLFSL